MRDVCETVFVTVWDLFETASKLFESLLFCVGTVSRHMLKLLVWNVLRYVWYWFRMVFILVWNIVTYLKQLMIIWDCLKRVWKYLRHVLHVFRKRLIRVWNLFEVVPKRFETVLKRIWRLFETSWNHLRHVWNLFRNCLGDVWNVFETVWDMFDLPHIECQNMFLELFAS